MALSLIVPAMAANCTDLRAEPSGITETVSDSGVITRTLTRANTAERSIYSVPEDWIAQTRAELVQLGLDERAVKKMDDDTLWDIANAPEMVASIAYLRVSASGDAQTVTENTALTDAAKINEANRQAGTAIKPRASESDANNYVKVTTVTNKSAGISNTYTIVGTFTWITTKPDFGGKDAFHIASDNCTFATKDANGYISYHHKKYSGSSLISEEDEEVTMSPKLRSDDSGNVLGIGYVFDRPITRYSSTTSQKTDEYSDWYGYLMCRGVAIDSTLDSFCNTASYSHRIL